MRHAIVVVLLASVSAGCTFGQIRDGSATPPSRPAKVAPPKAAYLSKIAVAKEQKPAAPTAVENALVWSEKYSRAMEQLAAERKKNRELEEEKRALQAQIGDLHAELARAQQELEEANTLLIDVRAENEKWRANILGYRDEMRRSHLTELEALAKVLKLLGGELPATPASAETPTDQTAKGDQGESPE